MCDRKHRFSWICEKTVKSLFTADAFGDIIVAFHRECRGDREEMRKDAKIGGIFKDSKAEATVMLKKKLEDYVRTIPDFPLPGIMFRDITTVLADADGLQLAIDSMKKELEDLDFDVIAGAEARGFIFGAPLAYALHKPFVLIRKKGKLPGATVQQSYDLEYGKATVEMHKDAIKPGMKVVIVDDLIATGGTVLAGAKLIESLGGKVVRMLFLMELKGLLGRQRLKDYDVRSILAYEGK